MKIEFQTQYLVSTHGERTLYHDDMYGESVWICGDKPMGINSVDYREFNGIPLREIAEFLEYWGHKESMVAIEEMSALRKLRETWPK